MKRTLFEILGGLAVVVVLVSFHQRIDRLHDGSEELARLQRIVADTAAMAGSKSEIQSSREEILAQVTEHLDRLQQEVDEASQSAENASFLRAEIDATRREASLLRAELTRDVRQTQQLVDSYQNEMRQTGELTRDSILATRRQVDAMLGVMRPSPEVLDRELLAPTVQLNGDDTVGSGTLIRSSMDAESGEVQNYVITSYHVVRNILADTPRARTEGVEVTIYIGDERRIVRGHMVAHDVEIDAALIELDTDEVFASVARLIPRDMIDEINVWDPVYAMGCPLGNDPIPTTGELSSKTNVLNGTNYWMINAPTYYGNSGGGVYLGDGHYLIGVFSKIYTHGKGNPVVIPHMGLCTPITAIYDWLDREQYAFVVPATKDGQQPPMLMAAQPGK
ncbi:MAG: trypsin-like peptidase domain-containing protein [Planctomycetes bacterium]|nr:trypsin-like peptidase domain-containing protein [Planctomycetota bacterium]